MFYFQESLFKTDTLLSSGQNMDSRNICARLHAVMKFNSWNCFFTFLFVLLFNKESFVWHLLSPLQHENHWMIQAPTVPTIFTYSGWCSVFVSWYDTLVLSRNIPTVLVLSWSCCCFSIAFYPLIYVMV